MWNSAFLYSQVVVFLLGGLWLPTGGSPAAGDAGKQILVSLSKSVVIRSPGFPSCCTVTRFLDVTVSLDGVGDAFIQVVFDDLDIPRNASLKVYSGKDVSSPLFPVQPMYDSGVWSRPIIGFVGKAVHIHFDAPYSGNGEYVGFKATVAMLPEGSSWGHNSYPVTDCPTVHDPMDSGSVHLFSFENGKRLASLYYDCIWQIKKPFGLHYIKTYIRFTGLNIDHGDMELRRGLSSFSPLIFHYNSRKAGKPLTKDGLYASRQYGTCKAGNSWTNICMPQDGYTSSEGFYLRIKMPLAGPDMHVQFVYGAFEQASNSYPNCTLSIWQRRIIPGFRCKSSRWCIPAENTCNDLENCFDASDEDTTMCAGRALKNKVQVVPVPPSLPLPSIMNDAISDCGGFSKLCHDGSCISMLDLCSNQQCNNKYEIECEDGTCIHAYSSCKTYTARVRGVCLPYEKLCRDGKCRSIADACDGCQSFEKMCNDGQCRSYDISCDREIPVCPSYRPNKCHSYNRCFYDFDRCNGDPFCYDGSDEWNCVAKTDRKYMYAIFAVIAVIVVVAVIVYCRKRARDLAERVEEDEPVMSGTRSSYTAIHTRSRATTRSNPQSAARPSSPAITDHLMDREPQTGTEETPSAPPPSYDEAMHNGAAEEQGLPTYIDATSTNVH